jgi:hypothetical protein
VEEELSAFLAGNRMAGVIVVRPLEAPRRAELAGPMPAGARKGKP